MTETLTNDYLVKRTLNSHLLVTILATLSATLSMMINGLIIGQSMGASAVAAFGLASPVFILMTAVAGIFSNGGTIRCALHMGKGDDRMVGVNFTITNIASLFVGILMSVVFIAFSEPLAAALGAKGEILSMTSNYIRGLGFGVIPFIISQNLILYLRMDNDQKLSMIAVLSMIAANLLLALVLVISMGAGMFGIGISISVSYFVCLLVALLHFRRKDNMIHMGKLNDFKESSSKSELKQVVNAGMTTALNRGCQTLKNLFLNQYLLMLAGTAAVTALSIQTSVNQILIALSMGYGMMVAMMCGMFFGEKDSRAIEDTVKVSLRSGLIVSVAAAAVVIVFAQQIVQMFIGSASASDIEMATRCIRFFALSQPTSTVCLILLYLYQSTKKVMFANLISVTRGVLYVVLISFAFAPVFGVDAVWLSFFFAELLSIITIFIAIRVKTKKFPRNVRDLLMLPDDINGSDREFDISIGNDSEELDRLSDKISAFCAENGVDTEKTDRLSLCVEEMADNIIKYAFDDGKKYFIDIRVKILGDGSLILRMRDDGKKFNPLQDSVGDHYGIRVMQTMASSVEYRNSVKLNNLVITV